MKDLWNVRNNARFVLSLLVIVSLSGCGLLEPEVCHHGIFYDVEPAEATIVLGASFTPVATIESCPKGKRPISLSWSAEDPSIVEVDSESGRVTGLAEGQTDVAGANEDGQPIVMVRVTVQGSG